MLHSPRGVLRIADRLSASIASNSHGELDRGGGFEVDRRTLGSLFSTVADVSDRKRFADSFVVCSCSKLLLLTLRGTSSTPRREASGVWDFGPAAVLETADAEAREITLAGKLTARGGLYAGWRNGGIERESRFAISDCPKIWLLRGALPKLLTE